MSVWPDPLHCDSIPVLLSAGDPALTCFVRRDLPAEGEPGPTSALWELPEPRRLLRKQAVDGSWPYPGGNPETTPGSNYAVLETFRSLGVLVEMYGFDRSHPALAAAAEYIFSCQAAQGDIRGILGNQYMPYYHAAILELLIKAGYAADSRVIRGLEWLLSVRQDDGGWIVPMQAVPPECAAARHLGGAGDPSQPGAALLAPGDRHGLAGIRRASGLPPSSRCAGRRSPAEGPLLPGRQIQRP